MFHRMPGVETLVHEELLSLMVHVLDWQHVTHSVDASTPASELRAMIHVATSSMTVDAHRMSSVYQGFADMLNDSNVIDMRVNLTFGAAVVFNRLAHNESMDDVPVHFAVEALPHAVVDVIPLLIDHCMRSHASDLTQFESNMIVTSIALLTDIKARVAMLKRVHAAGLSCNVQFTTAQVIHDLIKSGMNMECILHDMYTPEYTLLNSPEIIDVFRGYMTPDHVMRMTLHAPMHVLMYCVKYLWTRMTFECMVQMLTSAHVTFATLSQREALFACLDFGGISGMAAAFGVMDHPLLRRAVSKHADVCVLIEHIMLRDSVEKEPHPLKPCRIEPPTSVTGRHPSAVLLDAILMNESLVEYLDYM